MPTVSEGLTNPTSWNEIFKTLGFSGGLVILFVVVGLVVAICLGWIIYRVAFWLFGESGWLKKIVEKGVDRFDAFLTTIETRTAINNTTTEKIMQHCSTTHEYGGACNVADMRLAARHGLSGLEKIAKDISPSAVNDFQEARKAIAEK